MRGKFGSTVGVLLFGVGFVLFLLGFDGHTTEALPFGIAGLIAGAIIGWPSLRAFRAAIRELDASGPQARQLAPSSGSAPTTVQCTGCGARARLRLDRPTHADCEHCGSHLALEPALVKRLTDAAIAVKAQAQADRQLSDVIRALPEKEAALRARLRTTTIVLIVMACALGLFGFLRRYTDDEWTGPFLFALLGVPVTLTIGLWSLRSLPKAVWGIVSHWTALQLPGESGLGCRACGAPLPASATPVLRCEFCGADSLASPALVARVAQDAAHTRNAVLGAQRQSRSADELAAFTAQSLPLAVVLIWFAIGAATGGVVGRWTSDFAISVPSQLRYAIVDGSIVGVQGTTLYFDATESKDVGVAPAKLLTPEELEGVETLSSGKITRVWSRLRAPARPCATTSTGSTLYLPGPYGGGERIAVMP